VAVLGALAACTPTSTTTITTVAERRVAALPGDAATMNRFTAARPNAPVRSNAAIAADFLDLSLRDGIGPAHHAHDALRGANLIAVNGSRRRRRWWPISTR
jgi:hypothetical protein